MRILYLTDPTPDYLADQLFTGLSRVLEDHAVIDFPYKAGYHEPAGGSHYLTQTPGKSHHADEIQDLLSQGWFNLAVLSSPRVGSVEALLSLTSRSRIPPLVLVDGEDGRGLREDLIERFHCPLYFKREYQDVSGWRPWRGQHVPGVHPLPFAVVLQAIPARQSSSRDVDISYVGRASHRKRARAVHLLRSAPNIRFEGGLYAEATDRRSKLAESSWASVLAKLQGDPYVTPKEQGIKLSPDEYYALLARSKMALSIRGGGFDTLRYWESVACGALLISEEPDIVIPHNFEDRRHAVFCRPDLADLIDLVRYYRQHDAEREAIASEGYAHLLKYHTCERRAEYFLALCGKVL